MVMKLLIFLCALVVIDARNFTNPLVDKGADPWMVYYKGFYYLLVTPWTDTISIRKAATLSELSAADNTAVFVYNGTDINAPELHQVDGKWYIYYTACSGSDISNGCHRNHVAESAGDDPMGPYTYKETFIDEKDKTSSEIDPTLLRINNKLYLVGSVFRPNSQDLFIRSLTSPIRAEGTKTIFSIPTYNWEKTGWTVNEGPEPLYNGKRVFVVYSASLCSTPDYKLGLVEFVGTDPMNANHWKKHPSPLFVRDDAVSVYGPGHNGFFMSPDGKENWIIYHANSKINGHCDGNRNPRAKKFVFGNDGFPVFGKPDAAGVSLEGPSGEP